MVVFTVLRRSRAVRLGASSDRVSPPRAQPEDVARTWFLSAGQRGNRWTRVRPWTTGNAVRALVHGSEYFAALADAIEDTGDGDLILFTDWRGDPDERLRADGPTVEEALKAAVLRGVQVKGLVWRSHTDRFRFSSEENRDLSQAVNDVGGEVLLDQRVRPLGSHHQKFFVIRHPSRPQDDVAFVGGIDLAHGRRDDADHRGDPQTQRFSSKYGDTPAWHDVQVEIRGPAVRDVEDTFRERWEDPAALSRLPWQVLPDILHRLDRSPGRLHVPEPDPPRAGTCAVQVLRTYPNRWPGYRFARNGERSVARGYAKAARRARRLIYIEDQYLWSVEVARVFADALRRTPELHLVAVVPRHPDIEDPVSVAAIDLGHSQALEMVRAVAPDRVHIFDIVNHDGLLVYVHAKVCVVDDVWATVGSDNFNRRSWTHDSELTAAVLDERRDGREPVDPAGAGVGARVFARDLRLRLLREHLDRDDDAGLIDPVEAVAHMQSAAAALDAWHEGGCVGPRPPGRLREHRVAPLPRWQRVLAGVPYRTIIDPDGRPPGMKLGRLH